jgi:proteasome lid subunit RPN8/RPN11
MLKHGRAGIPMEVMGLMLGEFVDDYTVRVIDVFAMPQNGTVSVHSACNDANSIAMGRKPLLVLLLQVAVESYIVLRC